MTIREYLSQLPKNTDVTFVFQHTVKSEAGPFYESRYSTGSLRAAWDWLKFGEAFLDGNLVINADHPPIDVTGLWTRKYKSGSLRCAMVTTEADLLTHYGPEQGRRMIDYYKRTVK